MLIDNRSPLEQSKDAFSTFQTAGSFLTVEKMSYLGRKVAYLKAVAKPSGVMGFCELLWSIIGLSSLHKVVEIAKAFFITPLLKKDELTDEKLRLFLETENRLKTLREKIETYNRKWYHLAKIKSFDIPDYGELQTARAICRASQVAGEAARKAYEGIGPTMIPHANPPEPQTEPPAIPQPGSRMHDKWGDDSIQPSSPKRQDWSTEVASPLQTQLPIPAQTASSPSSSSEEEEVAKPEEGKEESTKPVQQIPQEPPSVPKPQKLSLRDRANSISGFIGRTFTRTFSLRRMAIQNNPRPPASKVSPRQVVTTATAEPEPNDVADDVLPHFESSQEIGQTARTRSSEIVIGINRRPTDKPSDISPEHAVESPPQSPKSPSDPSQEGFDEDQRSAVFVANALSGPPPSTAFVQYPPTPATPDEPQRITGRSRFDSVGTLSLDPASFFGESNPPPRKSASPPVYPQSGTGSPPLPPQPQSRTASPPSLEETGVLSVPSKSFSVTETMHEKTGQTPGPAVLPDDTAFKAPLPKQKRPSSPPQQDAKESSVASVTTLPPQTIQERVEQAREAPIPPDDTDAPLPEENYSESLTSDQPCDPPSAADLKEDPQVTVSHNPLEFFAQLQKAIQEGRAPDIEASPELQQRFRGRRASRSSLKQGPQDEGAAAEEKGSPKEGVDMDVLPPSDSKNPQAPTSELPLQETTPKTPPRTPTYSSPAQRALSTQGDGMPSGTWTRAKRSGSIIPPKLFAATYDTTPRRNSVSQKAPLRPGTQPDAPPHWNESTLHPLLSLRQGAGASPQLHLQAEPGTPPTRRSHASQGFRCQ